MKLESPMTVWVAIYSHEYGSDVRVFDNEQACRDWRDRIATNWWDDEFPDDEAPKENIGGEYFERLAEQGVSESFSWYNAEVESKA